MGKNTLRQSNCFVQSSQFLLARLEYGDGVTLRASNSLFPIPLNPQTSRPSPLQRPSYAQMCTFALATPILPKCINDSSLIRHLASLNPFTSRVRLPFILIPSRPTGIPRMCRLVTLNLVPLQTTPFN
ncbi:unnamed protein product [Protopolystoma xenopodis]|uniref:Uncharacterized protein n=1 Tax=Protopolystoma xenopodis TaxID=117903 RepID=A0A3S5A7C9_9PLAT|nr:unnamed protein product [Protopolystoma xenopodis]